MSTTTDAINDLVTDAVTKVMAERDALAKELEEVLGYAGHHDQCAAKFSEHAKCGCGWTALRERHAKGKT